MEVGTAPARKLGWLVMFVFAFAVGMSWLGAVLNVRAGNGAAALLGVAVSLLFLLFFMSGLWLAFYAVRIRVTRREVAVCCFYRWRSIAMDEVEFFEEGGGNMILGNSGKRIAFPSFKYWTRRSRQEPVKLLVTSLAERDIRLVSTLRAALPFNRGNV